MRAGHRSVPHTADTRIEAWAPTRELCLAEAVSAMVETFADVSGARPTDCATAELADDSDADLVVDLLNEVIYLMDTADVVPVAATVRPAKTGYEVRFDVTDLDEVELVGAIPKAVSLHELRFDEGPDGFSCAVTLDV